jgi:hypothetical protein
VYSAHCKTTFSLGAIDADAMIAGAIFISATAKELPQCSEAITCGAFGARRR